MSSGSCCPVILVDHAAQDAASLDRLADRYDHAGVVVGWMLIQALVRPMPVEVVLVVAYHRAGVLFVVDQDPVGALGPDLRTKRSANAFALGVRGGDFITSMPSAAEPTDGGLPRRHVSLRSDVTVGVGGVVGFVAGQEPCDEVAGFLHTKSDASAPSLTIERRRASISYVKILHPLTP